MTYKNTGKVPSKCSLTQLLPIVYDALDSSEFFFERGLDFRGPAFAASYPAHVGRVYAELFGNAGVKTKVKPMGYENRIVRHRLECVGNTDSDSMCGKPYRFKVLIFGIPRNSLTCWV